MPKKKRGSGFTVCKRGRFHDGRRATVSRTDSAYREEDSNKLPSGSPEIDDSNSGSVTSDLSRKVDVEIASLADGLDVEFHDEPEDICEVPHPDRILTPRGTDCIEVGKTIYEEALNLFCLVLPTYWRAIQGRVGFHLVCVSKGDRNIHVQREVFACLNGELEVFVHKKAMSEEFCSKNFKDLGSSVSLRASPVKAFVDRGAKAVQIISSYEICAGADQTKLESLWKLDNSGVVDGNAYDESRYVKTYRSHGCPLLIPVRNWTCSECKKLIRRLKLRHKNHVEDQLTTKGRDSYMDEHQLRFKIAEQRRELKKARNRVDYLEKRVNYLIQTEGVNIDQTTGDTLAEILRDTKLTPIQQLFIQQQYKMSTVKGATGMRWHPTMIRFALLIKSTSTACYSVIQSSGVIQLPSQRTLFDFEHAIPRSEGVFFEKLDKLQQKVIQFDKGHQHFHSLLMDEIHICHKLVYRKSDGSLIGYVKLNEVEYEIESLMASFKAGKTVEEKPSVATVLKY